MLGDIGCSRQEESDWHLWCCSHASTGWERAWQSCIELYRDVGKHLRILYHGMAWLFFACFACQWSFRTLYLGTRAWLVGQLPLGPGDKSEKCIEMYRNDKCLFSMFLRLVYQLQCWNCNLQARVAPIFSTNPRQITSCLWAPLFCMHLGSSTCFVSFEDLPPFCLVA